MNTELLHVFSPELEVHQNDANNDEWLKTNDAQSEEFDLDSFFNVQSEKEDSKKVETEPDLLTTLKAASHESIVTLSSKITADTFAAGASMTSSIFSTLGSLVGSCGVFCAHGVGALAQAGGNLGSVAGGMNMPGFSVDEHGHFKLDGNIDSLSKATGLSKGALLSGKLSAEDILSALFSAFGHGIHCLFGFGLIDCIFDGLLPGTKAKAA